MPGVEVGAAFNNIPSGVLFGVFEARDEATPSSMMYWGDIQAGRDIAATLIEMCVSTGSSGLRNRIIN